MPYTNAHNKTLSLSNQEENEGNNQLTPERSKANEYDIKR
jgi:hypothetical protein